MPFPGPQSDKAHKLESGRSLHQP
uniref:Uncharacterized protein n=1 Tax=Arundo donax TaxID=35708 RepID=A0A0A9GMX2_ARUDO